MRRIILKENAESRSQKKAINYLIDEWELPKDNAEKWVRDILRKHFKVLNGNHRMGKYTFGLTRLFFEGPCGTNHSSDKFKNNLNTILNIISHEEKYYKEYNDDFNGLSYNELCLEFKKDILYFTDGREKEELKDFTSINEENYYKVIRINSFEEASKFGKYVNWCICHDEESYNNYVEYGENVFYFLLRDGFTKETKEGYDKATNDDDYALSMIAVSVKVGTNDIKTCNTRRNRDVVGNDSQYDWVDISKLIKTNIKKVIGEYEASQYSSYISNHYFKFHYEDDMIEFNDNVNQEDIDEILKIANDIFVRRYESEDRGGDSPLLVQIRKGRYVSFSQVAMKFIRRDTELLDVLGNCIKSYYYDKLTKICNGIRNVITNLVEVGDVDYEFKDENEQTNVNGVISGITFKVEFSGDDFEDYDDGGEPIDKEDDLEFHQNYVRDIMRNIGNKLGIYAEYDDDEWNGIYKYTLEIGEDLKDSYLNTSKFSNMLMKIYDYCKNDITDDL